LSIDYERFARLAELTRGAWPDDEVSISMNAGGMHMAAGKTHIVLAHKDLDLFEAALLVLNKKPLELLSPGASTMLRKAMEQLAELWSVRGADVVLSGRKLDDPFTEGEGVGMQNCAEALRKALAQHLSDVGA
jgi:hypothetical protein